MGITRSASLAILVPIALLLNGCSKSQVPKDESPAAPTVQRATTSSIDDATWVGFDRRRSDVYRKQLLAAPEVLVVRESHYSLSHTNGIGVHYGWINGKIADLHITFSDLVRYAYGGDYARTEFPAKWTHGQLTNKFDIIATVPNAQQALQAEAQKFLREQYHLAWHADDRDTDVLVLRVRDPQLLQSKTTTNFAASTGINEREFVGELKNYFSKPVINETGATNRYEKVIGQVPARWVNGRTTNIEANNQFLNAFGLELIPETRRQRWLVMEELE